MKHFQVAQYENGVSLEQQSARAAEVGVPVIVSCTPDSEDCNPGTMIIIDGQPARIVRIVPQPEAAVIYRKMGFAPEHIARTGPRYIEIEAD